MVSIRLSLLFLWLIPNLVSCGDEGLTFASLPVALGESLTLHCTFNCTAGFVRGCWRIGSDNSRCLGTNSQSDVCTVSLHLANLTPRDLRRQYICYTRHTDEPKLREKIKRIVSLYPQARTIAPDRTVTPKTTAGNESLPAEAKDSTGGDFTGIKVLATVTIAVAIVLAALAFYLGVKRNRQSWNGKGEFVPPMSGSPSPSPHGVVSPAQGSSSSTHCERVIVRIPTPDNESDTEVPYADIMITVRGVSTPELSQVCYLTPGDQKECWLDESRCLLQASRSADRLHVHQPREVSRKMSTSSEYAIITYA